MKLHADEHLNVVVGLDGGRAWEGSLLEDLKIDQNNIDCELADHPSRAAWWNALAELAGVTVDRHYEEWKDRMAGAEIEIKDRAVREGKKPPSEKIVEARARLAPEVQAARETYFRAREALSQLRAGMRSYEHRREALMALARRITSEYTSSIMEVKQSLKEAPEESRARRVQAAATIKRRFQD